MVINQKQSTKAVLDCGLLEWGSSVTRKRYEASFLSPSRSFNNTEQTNIGCTEILACVLEADAFDTEK